MQHTWNATDFSIANDIDNTAIIVQISGWATSKGLRGWIRRDNDKIKGCFVYNAFWGGRHQIQSQLRTMVPTNIVISEPYSPDGTGFVKEVSSFAVLPDLNGQGWRKQSRVQIDRVDHRGSILGWANIPHRFGKGSLGHL